MKNILEEIDGDVRFSSQVREYILDENMQLKAIVLKNGEEVDYERIHRHFSPKHPMIRTPKGMKKTLDSLFVHEFVDKRAAY